jgi:hypothetical protein
MSTITRSELIRRIYGSDLGKLINEVKEVQAKYDSVFQGIFLDNEDYMSIGLIDGLMEENLNKVISTTCEQIKIQIPTKDRCLEMIADLNSQLIRPLSKTKEKTLIKFMQNNPNNLYYVVDNKIETFKLY